MIGILQQILSVISLLFTGLISILQSTALLLVSIPKFLLYITSSVVLLPSVLVPFILFGVSASIILLILGRN